VRGAYAIVLQVLLLIEGNMCCIDLYALHFSQTLHATNKMWEMDYEQDPIQIMEKLEKPRMTFFQWDNVE
jgi:hypothetical protein